MYKEQLLERKHEQVKEDYAVLDETPGKEMPLVHDAQQQ